MQGKNEHPVRSALVSQGDSCMAEHDSQHAIGFINNISTPIPATCLYYGN